MSLTFPYPVSSGTTFQSGQSPVYIYNGLYWTIDKTNRSTSGTSGLSGSSGTSGAQGPAGETLTVKGVYPSYSGLTGLTPTNLDTYIVQDTSHLWIYNPSSPSANGIGWVDMGQIQGPKGDSGTSGSSGSNGSSGTSGSSGGTGSSGSSGSSGSNGSSGTSGSNGSSGTSGSNGTSGSSGSNGSSGTSGTSGSSGSNGSSGTSGTSGSNGSSGTSGSSGSNGSSGTSGSSGSSGTAGTSGTSGSSGSSGSAGTSGTSGSSGSSGTSGTSGSSGTAGTSGSSGTSGLVTLTGSTAGGLITYNGSGTNATVQSGVTYSGTTLTAPTGSFSNVIVNGQPTTYGNVNGSYLFASNNADQSNVGNGTAVIFQSSNASNGFLITKGSNTQVTLTAGNTYKMEAIIRRFQSSSTWGIFKWYDVTNSAYVGLEAFGETVTSPTAVATTGIATYYVTPSVNTTYELRQTTSNTITVSGGYASYEITQLNPTVAMQATATGTLNTDYISVGNNGSTQNVAASGTDIVFDTNISSSGIGYNNTTGVFTLTAGKTYQIQSEIAFQEYSGNGYLLGQLVDATTNTGINTQVVSYPYNTGFNEVNNIVSDIIYTPNTNQTVKFRIIGGASGLTAKQRGGGFSRASIVQIANQFSLTAISGLTTTSNVNVGGNLTLTGSFQGVEPSYTFADDSANASWYLLGTWNTVQSGQMLYMRIVSHSGYNGVASQNQITELTWAASNGTATYSGSTGLMYGAGQACANSRLGTGNGSYNSPSSFRMVQVSQTQYQVYGYFGPYTRGSSYTVQTSNLCSWVHSGLPVGTPSGNYIAISISTY